MPKEYKKKPFDATTQGMGHQEMARRTQQHDILATKKYEAYKALDLGIDSKWVQKSTKGNEMNPWVMKKIGQMVGQQEIANTNMKDALKMWGTASKFEATKGYSTKPKFKEFKGSRRTKESIAKGMRRNKLGR